MQPSGARDRVRGAANIAGDERRGWEEGIGRNRSQRWVDTEYVSPLAIALFFPANQMSSLEWSTTVSTHELDENRFGFFTLSFMDLAYLGVVFR